MRIPDTIAKLFNLSRPRKLGENKRNKRVDLRRKRQERYGEREAEGNEARVRHVPEARTMSLCRREPAEPQGLLPLPALHAYGIRTVISRRHARIIPRNA